MERDSLEARRPVICGLGTGCVRLFCTQLLRVPGRCAGNLSNNAVRLYLLFVGLLEQYLGHPVSSGEVTAGRIEDAEQLCEVVSSVGVIRDPL